MSLGTAERLSGSTNERYGLAKSISVMPGDTVKMEVYVKYVDTNSSNWTSALNTLLSQIAAGTAPAGTVVDGANYSTSTSSFSYAGLLNTSGSTGTGPKAYMNWLIFDKNFVLKNGGFVRMTDAAREYGQDALHEKLTASFAINEPGYVYLYLSNENDAPVEVYFDDWKVTQVKSPIVEANDYYPYGGLMTTSYTREASLLNRWKYNNKELITDLNLGWMDYGVRQRGDFDPRWRQIDPLSEQMRRWSPYNYAFDNPIRFIDPDGMSPDPALGAIKNEIKKVEGVWNNIVNKVDKAVDKIMDALTFVEDIPKEETTEKKEPLNDLVVNIHDDEHHKAGPDNKYLPAAGPNADPSNIEKSFLDAVFAVESLKRPTAGDLGEKVEMIATAAEKAKGAYDAANNSNTTPVDTTWIKDNGWGNTGPNNSYIVNYGKDSTAQFFLITKDPPKKKN